MLPHCKDFVRPILEVLVAASTGVESAELYECVARRAGLTPGDREPVVAGGSPKYKVRIKQARYWLKKRGFVEATGTRLWRSTPAGAVYLEETGAHPKSLSRLLPDSNSRVLTDESDQMRDADDASPHEQIQDALDKMVEQLTDELLERLCAGTPDFVERAVLRLLRAMGYGTSGRIEHVGGRGDRGVDGVLFLDRLELERVHMQAKKWSRSKKIEPRWVREFVGALARDRCQRGVFITTAQFTESARNEATDCGRALRLIDGGELANLMIEHGVGVSRLRTVVLPELDLDFFDDA